MDSTFAVIRREAERQATTGHRQAALDLLDSLRGSEPTAAVAVLRAKILCQRGEFAGAAASYREALAIEPGNESARRGVMLADTLARSPLGRVRLHARRWGLALVALAGIGAGVWAAGTERGAPSNRELADSLTRIEREHVEDLRTAVSRTEGALQELKRTTDVNQTQLRALLTEQARANAQMREQLRRLDKRTADMINAAQPAKTPATPPKDLR
jgi:tetratricopeptide (TPR) repeat protein